MKYFYFLVIVDPCLNHECINDGTCVPLDGTESESGSESGSAFDLNLVFAYECVCPPTHTGMFCREKGIQISYMAFNGDMSHVGDKTCLDLSLFDKTCHVLSLFDAETNIPDWSAHAHNTSYWYCFGIR